MGPTEISLPGDKRSEPVIILRKGAAAPILLRTMSPRLRAPHGARRGTDSKTFKDTETMPDARKRLVGFCATHLPGSIPHDNGIAQRGPDEAAERLRAAARRGRIIRG